MSTRTPVAALTGATFDLAIIGGGINGLAIAREAAVRGLSVALFDKGDIGSGTSAYSSRMIHGGLRYLEHGEIRLVRESLRDREALLRTAPHLVSPLAFVVPTYSHNHVPAWKLRAGMIAYDALSAGKSMEHHRHLGAAGLRAQLPGLNPAGLGGAVEYFDAQCTLTERLVVEVGLAAAQAGAHIVTYASVEQVVTRGGAAIGLQVRDLHGRLDEAGVPVPGPPQLIRARHIVNAAGPWVDAVDMGGAASSYIGGTKGTHLVVAPFPGAPDRAVYYEARSDNRAILVLPWDGRYLIGTTDDRFTGDLDTVCATVGEVDYLISETNALIPQAGLTRASVQLTYAGVRPLPYVHGAAPGDVPRSHLILAHPCVRGLTVVVGGKLTPHLSLATEVVDALRPGAPAARPALRRRLLPGAPRPHRSSHVPFSSSPQSRTALLGPAQGRLRALLPQVPDAVLRRLVNTYGTRSLLVGRIAQRQPELATVMPTTPGGVLGAEIAFALRAEGATTLDDVVRRRTVTGLGPDLGLAGRKELARIAAAVAGWSPAREVAEIELLECTAERLRPPR